MQGVYRDHVSAILLMALLAICMSYPVIFHLQDSLVGQGGDPWQAMWRFEHTGSGGLQQFLQDFSGAGEARLVNVSIWPWMPLHYTFGEPVAYNLTWLIVMMLSGYAMALFVKILANQKSIFSAAPLLAGIAYMFLPYRSAHALGHFGAMQLQWIPFICAAVVTYIRKPQLWKIATIGVLFSIQAWTEHHYALWLMIFAVIAMIVYRKELLANLLNSHPIRNGKRLGEVMLLAIIFIFGVVIPYIPTLKLATTNNTALELGVDQTIRFSADVFSFITPSPQHPVWGTFFDSLFGKYFTGNNAESVQYVGVSILIAILFFHRHIPVRQKRLWSIAIIVFGFISLGPVLHVFGKQTAIALPYALLAHLPVFSAIRVVARAGVMVSFAICVLLGWTIATNIHKSRTSSIVGLLICLEFLFLPFPLQSAKLSPAYHELSSLPGSRIIEIPAATNYTAASRSLYASALHGKEVIGNIALERGESASEYNLAKSVPAVRQLLYLRTTELLNSRPEFFDQNLVETLPDAMQYLDAYTILVHTDSLSPVQNDALSKFLSKIPELEKKPYGDIDLYTLNKNPYLSESDGVIFVRGDGWENIGYDPKRTSVFAEIPKQATAHFINVREALVPIEISFVFPFKESANISITLNGEPITLSSSGASATATVSLEKGSNTLTITNHGEHKAIIKQPSFQVIPWPKADEYPHF